MNDVFFRTRWIVVWLALSINRYLCLELTHVSARNLKIGYTYVTRLRKSLLHSKYRHSSVSITDITYGHSSYTTAGRRLFFWFWYGKFCPSAVCGAPISSRY